MARHASYGSHDITCHVVSTQYCDTLEVEGIFNRELGFGFGSVSVRVRVVRAVRRCVCVMLRTRLGAFQSKGSEWGSWGGVAWGGVSGRCPRGVGLVLVGFRLVLGRCSVNQCESL